MSYNSYLSQMMNRAQEALMIPLSTGSEVESFGWALYYCHQGLSELDTSGFEGHMQDSIAVLRDAVVLDGIASQQGEGRFQTKVRAMSTEERSALSKAINELSTSLNVNTFL